MFPRAIEHAFRLRGGSQTRIMVGDDGTPYVVKFKGNPQSTRVLANEYLACRLARMVGLTVPKPAVILVDEDTIRKQEIAFRLTAQEAAPQPGFQFASSLVTGEEVRDWMPSSVRSRVSNWKEFAGVLAFDKWTGNADGRQAVFQPGVATAKVPRDVHRFWLLFQCRRVEFSGCASARCV